MLNSSFDLDFHWWSSCCFDGCACEHKPLNDQFSHSVTWNTFLKPISSWEDAGYIWQNKLQMWIFSDTFTHVNFIVSSCSATWVVLSAIFSMLVLQDIEELIVSVQSLIFHSITWSWCDNEGNGMGGWGLIYLKNASDKGLFFHVTIKTN